MRICLLILLLALFSCNLVNKKKVDNHVKANVVLANENEEYTEYEEAEEYEQEGGYEYRDGLEYYNRNDILFSKYAVEVLDNFTKAPLAFEDNEAARYFRTRIKEAYQSDEISFAGSYISVIFGCGAGCVTGFIMDVRDGEIYALPLGEENMCFFDLEKAFFKPDSRLFISAVCGNLEDDEIYYIAYLWDEERKEFEKIEKEEFLE